MVEVEFDYSERTRQIHYLTLLRRVQMELYQHIRGIVLPYFHTDAWFVPDFDLMRDGQFLTELQGIDENVFECNSKYLLDCVAGLDLPVAEQTTFVKLEKDVYTYADEFFATALAFFLFEYKLTKVVVVPSMMGTQNSYYLNPHTDGSCTIWVAVRKDCDYRNVFKSVLAEIIMHEGNFKDATLMDWYIKKGIDDYMLNHTILKEILHFEGQIKVRSFMEGYKSDLFVESAKYFAKMGFPIRSCFSYKDQSIYYNNEPILGIQQAEIAVLKYLIDHRSEVVSYDDLATMYWGEESDDKFSLGALAKIIERLRQKMALNGVPESFLRTVRKQGYLLYD